jgi:hypothetical protein
LGVIVHLRLEEVGHVGGHEAARLGSEERTWAVGSDGGARAELALKAGSWFDASVVAALKGHQFSAPMYP